jgi:uncharacterized delta-60 repeat protein
VILVGGFSAWNGQSTGRIIRLSSAGSIDTAFSGNIGTGATGSIRTIAIQTDGKILIGRDGASHWNGSAFNGVIRLNQDGTRDTAFYSNVGTGVPFGQGYVANILVQPDNKILVVGSFANWSGVQAGGVVRLNADGTRDATFATNVGSGANGWTEGVAIQSDGKILIAGMFTSWNGQSAVGLVRLNTNGTLDETFGGNLGAGPQVDGTSPYIEQVAVQTDGSILLGGKFTRWNSASTTHLVRLNSNGIVRTLFPNNLSYSVDPYPAPTFHIQTGGNIVIYGSFTTWTAQSVGRIVRLNGSDVLN